MPRARIRCINTLVLVQPQHCKIKTPTSLSGHTADGEGSGGYVDLYKSKEEIEKSKNQKVNEEVISSDTGQGGKHEKYEKVREFQRKGVSLDSLTRRLRSHPSLENLSIVRWLEGILEKEIDKESLSLKQLLLGYRERLNEDIKKKDESNWLQRLVRGIAGGKDKGDGIVALETADGQITELGVAVLNAVLKGFLEHAYTLNSSATEDKHSTHVGNTINVPGYLVLSSDLKEQLMATTPLLNPMGQKTDSTKVNVLPPVKINFEENKNSSTILGQMLRDPPVSTKDRKNFPKGVKQSKKYDSRPPSKSYSKAKCSASGLFKKQSRKKLIVASSFDLPSSKDVKQPPNHLAEDRISAKGRGGPNWNSHLHSGKSNFRQKMTKAMKPFKLLYDIRSKASPLKKENSLHSETVGKKNARMPLQPKKIKPSPRWSPRFDSKERRRRSDVTEKTRGAGITLEIKEFLNSVINKSNNSDEQEAKHNGENISIHDADSTAPRVAFAIPKTMLMDAPLTPLNPPFKVNKYHCHKFIPPCARYIDIHSQRRHHRLRGGTVEYLQRSKGSRKQSELVNFLLMLHANQSKKCNDTSDEDMYYDDDEGNEEDDDLDDEDDDDDDDPLQEVLGQQTTTNSDTGLSGCQKATPLPCEKCFTQKQGSTGGSKKNEGNQTKSPFCKTEELTIEFSTRVPVKDLEVSLEAPERNEISNQNETVEDNGVTSAPKSTQNQGCGCQTCSSTKCCTCPPRTSSTCPTKPDPNTCPTRPPTCSRSTPSTGKDQMQSCTSPTPTCSTPKPCTTPARSTYTCPPSKCTTCPTTTCEPISQQHEQITMIPRPPVTVVTRPDCFETAAVRFGKLKLIFNESQVTTHSPCIHIHNSDICRKKGSRRRLRLMARYSNHPDIKNRFKLIPVRRMKQGRIQYDEIYGGRPVNHRRVGHHSRKAKLSKARLKQLEQAGFLGIIPESDKQGLFLPYVPYRLIHVKDVETPLEMKHGIIGDIDKAHKSRLGQSINIIGPLRRNTLQRLLGTDHEETNRFQEAASKKEEADYEDEYKNYLEETTVNSNT